MNGFCITGDKAERVKLSSLRPLTNLQEAAKVAQRKTQAAPGDFPLGVLEFG